MAHVRVWIRDHTTGDNNKMRGFESTLNKAQCKLSLRDQVLLPIVDNQPANESTVFTSVEVDNRSLLAADLMRPCSDYVTHGSLVVVVALAVEGR